MPIKNFTARQKISPLKLERAKQLRRELTPAEALLWQELRRNRLGAPFRRQQIIAGFISDFYCSAAALVIEVDGGIHRRVLQARADRLRDAGLRRLGLRVVHFQNEDVLTRLPEVLDQIRAIIRT